MPYYLAAITRLNNLLLSVMMSVVLLTACTATGATPEPAPGDTRQIRASDGETGIITVMYPAQWLALEQADHSISIANSPQAMRSYDINMTELQSGHIAGTVSALKKTVIPVDIDNTPQGVLSYILDTVSQGGRVEYTFGTVDSVDFNGRNGARSEGFGTEADSETALEVRLLVVETDDAYGILFFGAPFGELAIAYDKLNAIAASFQFDPIETDSNTD